MDLDRNDSPYLYEPFQNRKKHWKVNPWQGVLLFVLLVVAFQLLGSLLVLLFGAYGNGLAEMIFFMGGSILAAKLLGLSVREVFPLQIPKGKGLLGTFLMLLGVNRCMNALSLVLITLFPKAFAETNGQVASFITSMPFFWAVIVVALVPALSEEVFHRGLLQYTLQPLNRKWLIIFCMGIYFGVFHLSLLRFVPMLLLGMVISWLRQETNDMSYGMFYHFINNLLALSSAFVDTAQTNIDYEISLLMTGVMFLMASVGPLLLFLGAELVSSAAAGRKASFFGGKKKSLLLLGCATAFFLVIGIVCIAIWVVSR